MHEVLRAFVTTTHRRTSTSCTKTYRRNHTYTSRFFLGISDESRVSVCQTAAPVFSPEISNTWAESQQCNRRIYNCFTVQGSPHCGKTFEPQEEERGDAGSAQVFVGDKIRVWGSGPIVPIAQHKIAFMYAIFRIVSSGSER